MVWIRASIHRRGGAAWAMGALLLAGCGEAGSPPAEHVSLAAGAVEAPTCVTIGRGQAGNITDARLRADFSFANFGSDPSFVVGNQFTQRISLIGFDLGPIPPTASITHASLALHELSELGPSSVEVHRITAPWTESTVSWTSFAGAYDPAVATSFSTGGAGATVNVDMTSLAQAWMTGTPNQGIALVTQGTNNSTWASSEGANAALRPALTVCYTTPSCADGVQNQGETGVDCGGPCAACDLCVGVTCTALDACHVAGACNPATGQCANPAAPDGTSCDDGDAATHADNCQSGTCVGVPFSQAFYRDADGDGHGDPSVTVMAASAPAGYVALADDCNDGDAAVHPGASESCDGKDNDCDGVVDEGCLCVTAVAGGDFHTCQIRADSSVWCSGSNQFGQLGDGTNTDRQSAVPVPGLTGVVELAMGDIHTCARKGDGSVWCWGYNGYGNLGDGTTVSRVSPVQVTALGDATGITAAFQHTCALESDGSVWCWGGNVLGQIGDGTTQNRVSPTRVAGLGNSAVSVTAGGQFTCARKADGSVACWGGNDYGQLGDGTKTKRTAPTQVFALGTSAVELSLGVVHSCARKADGSVWCWGDNTFGQLGDGTKTQRSSPVAVTALGLAGAEIAAGYGHTCARKTDGSVWCWGHNWHGEVGDGTLVDKTSPTQVAGLTGAVEITTGYDHTCARASDGSVSCWGLNRYGEVGDGTLQDRTTPVIVAPACAWCAATTVAGCTLAPTGSGGTDGTCAYDGVGACSYTCAGGAFTQVSNTCSTQTYQLSEYASGAQQMCAIKRSTGAAYCWGGGSLGSLGNGTTNGSTVPVAVSGGHVFASISAAGPGSDAGTTCGTTTSGAGYCWGYGGTGALGGGSIANASAPMPISGGLVFRQISAGYALSCGVTTAGAAYCWGYDDMGQLGNGTIGNPSTPTTLVPVPVSSGLLFSQVMVTGAGHHVCGLTYSGEAYCWGYGGFGQLGDGTSQSSTVPIAVAGGHQFTSLSGGFDFTCGLTTSGAAYCWGMGFYGSLGNGVAAHTSVPVAVSGGLVFESLVSGAGHTCGIAEGGAAYCWGWNFSGSLGVGASQPLSPARVTGGHRFVQLAVGYDFTCGLTTTNAVVCWGKNALGQLGNGTTVDATSPTPVVNLP